MNQIVELINQALSEHTCDHGDFAEETKKQRKKRNILNGDNYSELQSAGKRYLQSGLIGVKEGDLIKWKQGMKNRAFPDYEEAVVFMGIDDNYPHNTTDESHQPCYMENLSLMFGLFSSEGIFFILHADPSRFEKY